MKHRRLHNRRRAKRAEGVCICCSRRAVPDRVRCAACLETQRACERKRRGPSKRPCCRSLQRRLGKLRSALRKIADLSRCEPDYNYIGYTTEADEALAADDRARRKRG